jgi:AcrR family transcriptional regulator
MNAEDREEIILREATAYFAEKGLSAGTIELARRIGITQPLLYKYFPTKEALFERVYERLMPQSWNPSWLLLLDDETIPLRQRLKDFYCDYAASVLTYEHVRLFLFSGLTHNDFNARYYSVLTKRIFDRMARALRREYGDARANHAVTRAELEQVQSLHASVYHLAFRRWVHAEPLTEDLSALVGRKVDTFLDGVAQTDQQPARKKPRRESARLQ